MAICAHCNTQETEMYENGVPICLACATDIAAKIKPMERANYPRRTLDGTGRILPTDLKQSG